MKLSMLFGVAFLAGLMSAISAARAQDKPAATQPGKDQPAAQPTPKTTEPTVYVLMKTSMGDIALELNHDKAPITVDNFLSYTDQKFYDGTVFHRVIRNFMIQGGGFTPDMNQKPTGKGIKNEWQNGLKNDRGTIAMARLPSRPDSATSQFFINVKNNDNLDQPMDGAGYTVFGKVVEGMDVVDKIRAVKTGPRPMPQDPTRSHQDVPTETVTITEVRRMTPDEVKSLKGKIEKSDKGGDKK